MIEVFTFTNEKREICYCYLGLGSGVWVIWREWTSGKHPSAANRHPGVGGGALGGIVIVSKCRRRRLGDTPQRQRARPIKPREKAAIGGSRGCFVCTGGEGESERTQGEVGSMPGWMDGSTVHFPARAPRKQGRKNLIATVSYEIPLCPFWSLHIQNLGKRSIYLLKKLDFPKRDGFFPPPIRAPLVPIFFPPHLGSSCPHTTSCHDGFQGTRYWFCDAFHSSLRDTFSPSYWS